jgi:hypothetical protein
MTPKASTPITISSVNVVATTTLRNQCVSRTVNGMTKMANIKPAVKGMRKLCPHQSATMTASVAVTVAAVLERVYGAACCVECVGVVISYFIIFEPNCLAATVSDTLTVCCTVPHTEDYYLFICAMFANARSSLLDFFILKVRHTFSYIPMAIFLAQSEKQFAAHTIF